MRLAEDISDERIGDELSYFVLDGRRSFGLKFLIPFSEFIDPKSVDDRVLEIIHDYLAVFGIIEHAHDSEKIRSRGLQKSQQRVVQDIFHAAGPGIHPDLLENAHDAGSDQMTEFRTHLLERIECHRI